MNGIIEQLMQRQPKPKVINGQLERPYPIESKGDLNRARVLPPPMQAEVAPAEPSQGIAVELLKRLMTQQPAAPSEQPAGGFDYVMKRNQLMNGVGR